MNTPVNFKIATSLKEKGFDNLSEWAYQSGKLVHDSRNKEHKNWNKEKHVDCTAPTISEVIMWLYEKHGIWIQPTICSDKSFRVGCIEINNNPLVEHIVRNKNEQLYFNSPTEAYEAAIEYTLNNLI